MSAAGGRILFLAALIAFGGGAGLARAADLDCANAVGAREKLVCADPALTAAAQKLTAAFDSALQPLSAEGREALRDGQRSWIKFTDTVCGVGAQTAPAASAAGETPTACLARYDAMRQDQLDHATVVAAGRVFTRHESFSARPVADSSGFVTTVIAYPQVDRPRSASERAWNKRMVREAHRPAAPHPSANGYADSWVDYQIDNATAELVSMVFTRYWYGHGAAHGISARLPSTWLWREERALRAGDVFDRRKSWQDALAQLCFDRLSLEKRQKNIDYDASPATLRKLVASADRWTIERDGLGIQFQEYEIGPYVLGSPKVTIAWTALRPYLAARPPFRIPPS